jgi:hypothetical protein
MAPCNTIFHQMLKLIPRHVLGKLETEHGTGRQARTFTRWSQLVHLISMQLTARVSLRDGISSLKAQIRVSTTWESSRWPAPLFLTPITVGPPVFSPPPSPTCISAVWPMLLVTSSSSKTSFTAWTPPR